MSVNQFVVIFYVFCWGAARVRGCFRRWQQPLLRGPEWFFNVHVQPDFYAVEGKKILRAYWMRMLMTVVVEVPIATAIFISGHYQYLTWLILIMAVVVHVNHVFSVDLAERQARKFAVQEDEQPAPAMMLSLKTRRLSDYSNRQVERFIVFSTVLVLVWLVRYYFSAPEHHDLLLVFGEPAFLLYIQAGLLLAKQIVVGWRSPVPQVQAEEHMQAREAARKMYLLVCDINRIFAAGMLLLWPFLLKISPASRNLFATVLWIAFLAIGVVLMVWQEMMRKKVVLASLRARPTKLPDLLGQAEAPSWPLCYQPSIPMLVLKGVRGYSVNLANGLAQLSVAYLAGFAALMVFLVKVGH